MPQYTLPSLKREMEAWSKVHAERIAIESGTPTERRGGGDSISQVNIQRKTIQKAFEFYGNSLWHFGHNSGRRMSKAREIIDAVQETCKYEVSLDQLRRWVHGRKN